MSQVILFDQGKDGGLLIDPSSGIRPIPPFAPSILAHLGAIAQLLKAAQGTSLEEGTFRDLSSLTNKLSNLAVERVEGAVGPLVGMDSLVYLDDDGGFTCGSTGAPPKPIKRPTASSTTTLDLVTNGLLGTDLLEYLGRATAKGLGVAEILEEPSQVASRLDIKLSDLAVSNLRQLAPSQISKLPNTEDRELMDFFHKVVKDGRFIDRWTVEPVATATSLGVKLSNPVVDKILGASAIVGRTPEVANLSIEQGIVVGIVAIIVLDQQEPTESIIDRSQTRKF